MALDKADSISQINNLFPDNTAGEITPVDQRVVSTNAISSNLNLVDDIEQSVASSVDFLVGLKIDGAPVTLPVKEVKINQFSELPTVSGGKIPLLPDTEYTFENDVNIGSTGFTLAHNTVINGLDEHVVTIEFEGTGVMFTAVDSTFRIKNIGIRCPLGTFINASDVASLTTNFALFFNLIVWECNNIGIVTDLGLFSMVIVRFDKINNNGLLFVGSFGNLVGNFLLGVTEAGILFDLGTATFNAIDLVQFLFITSSGATAISGLTDSGNINTGGIGSVRFGKFLGAGASLSGITIQDALWNFLDNSGIGNTRSDGLLSQTDNSTETVITTVSTPVLLAGAWEIVRTSQFIGTAAGRLTYIGGRPIVVPVVLTTTAAVASGVNKDVNFYIGLNGSIIPSSKVKSNLSAGDTKNQSNIWQLELQPDDFVEAFAENITDIINLIVEDAKLRVN